MQGTPIPQGASISVMNQYKGAMLRTLAFLIIAISILFAIDWSRSPPTFNPMVMFLGIILAMMVFVAFPAARILRMRTCPACGRRAPADARLCPYCGNLFPPKS
jgi:hypothetical protein